MWWGMLNFEKINRLEQFGRVSYTVVVENGLRFEKEYISGYTEEEIDADIAATIEALTPTEEPTEQPIE
jgi:hypothetical protein